MAAAHAPKLAPGKRIVIDGQNVYQDSKIRNKEDVKFEVLDFNGNNTCNLMIYAVTYTNDGVAQTNTGQALPGPTPVLLGTIKIGS